MERERKREREREKEKEREKEREIVKVMENKLKKKKRQICKQYKSESSGDKETCLGLSMLKMTRNYMMTFKVR